MTRAYQFVFGLVFMISLTLFLRHQYAYVMQQATAKPKPFTFTRQHHDAYRKCVTCGGTGRIGSYNFGTGRRMTSSENCPTCNGTGWIDDPSPSR